MNLKEIKELVDLVTEKGITEFELERAGVRVHIKRGAPAPAGFAGAPAAAVLPTAVHYGAPALPPPAGPAGYPPGSPVAALPAGSAAATGYAEAAPHAEPRAEDVHVVKAPIVGTFYDAPSPGAPPFAGVGDRVEVGKVLCVIEAMKLMNEIESDVAGEIVKKYVENAQPVEYGEFLFAIRPTKGKK